MDAPEPGPFDNDLEYTGWLIVRGGLPASEFARLKDGPERDWWVAAIRRAEQIRVRELEQFADAVAHLLGGGDA